jgi:hypothetical protein
MSSAGAAPRAAASTSSARAEASRRNGAKSRGPKMPEGKARSAQNALKHGLRAQKHVVLPDEDAAGFAALEAALADELAPQGVLQSLLVGRIARAVWRLERAEQLEVELFEWRRRQGGGIGVALMRDGNGTRSFETILRYRGAAQAELTRALRTLKALQAEQAMPRVAAAAEPARPEPTTPTPPARIRPRRAADRPAAHLTPNEPTALLHPNEPAPPEFERTRAEIATEGTRTKIATEGTRAAERGRGLHPRALGRPSSMSGEKGSAGSHPHRPRSRDGAPT